MAQGQMVMPGLICAHTHFYGAFSRGLATPGEPSRNFQEILANLWWKLDKGLDEEASSIPRLLCWRMPRGMAAQLFLITTPRQTALMGRWISKLTL